MNPGLAHARKSFRIGLSGARPATGGPTRSSAEQHGFTIAEVMMAAIVMAFAITTSITTMQRAFLAVDAARGISYASQIMQTEFEKMRLLDYATVSAYSSSETTIPVDSSFSSNNAIGNRYTLTRTATLVHTGMIQVTLRISWKTYDGRTLTRSYTTYYGQNGLYDYVSS